MRNTEHAVKKFALVGPQSVGKTTIAGLYRRRFADNPHIAIFEGGAQNFLQSDPGMIETLDPLDLQKQIQNCSLQREKGAYQPGVEIMLFDRSVIDPIVYSQFHKMKDAEQLVSTVIDWIPTYTHFFLLSPAGVPHATDRFIHETPEERTAIYTEFSNFLKGNVLPYETVSGTLASRVKKIDKTIFHYTGNHTIFENS